MSVSERVVEWCICAIGTHPSHPVDITGALLGYLRSIQDVHELVTACLRRICDCKEDEVVSGETRPDPPSLAGVAKGRARPLTYMRENNDIPWSLIVI